MNRRQFGLSLAGAVILAQQVRESRMRWIRRARA